jgi:hypothetical protein
MTGAIATMVINALIIVLLAITIGYCWLLNRRIKVLQDTRGELAKLLKHFDVSTERASESIVALQSASKKIGDSIQNRIDQANYLIDDLTFMIEKGNKLANQMEAGFAVGRAQARVTATQPPRPARPEPKPEPVEVKPDPKSAKDVEEAVMERVVNDDRVPSSIKQFFEKSSFTRYELPKEGAPPAKPRGVAGSALGEALERVVNRNKDAEEMPAGRNRSRSEQELLDLIKAGIKG